MGTSTLSVPLTSSVLQLSMWSVLVLVVLTTVGGTQAKRKLLLNIGCADSQRSSPGDLVRLGRLDGSVESVVLGPDPRSEWEGLCAGDVMAIDQEEVLVEMITRRLGTARKGRGEGKVEGCGVPDGARHMDNVTFTSRARIPTVIYLRYPHPTGNIPITVRQRGQEGTTVDRSTDTVMLGGNSLPPGWEQGMKGTCVGERRLLLLAPSMAFGARGVYQKIPPHSPLELTIEVHSIEREKDQELPRTAPVEDPRDPVISFLRLGSKGELFSFAGNEE